MKRIYRLIASACILGCGQVVFAQTSGDSTAVHRKDNSLDSTQVIKESIIIGTPAGYKYREVIGNTTIAENREEGSFIWENCFDEESQVNEYALTLFIKEEDDLYRKHEEFHYQKAYEPERVKELLEEAGLKVEAIYDAFTREPVREDSERIYFIARECTK